MATTPHLGITLLESSQAQKEITVNEALQRIDALLNSGVIDHDLATPPGSPATGDVYIVAASPTGAWSGKATSIAYFDQIWRFITPAEGAMLWVNDENLHVVFDGSAWQTVSTSSGDMLKSTYDPANIAQQVVGTTATQTLTNKTLTSPTFNAFTMTSTTVTMSGGSMSFQGSSSPYIEVRETGTPVRMFMQATSIDGSFGSITNHPTLYPQQQHQPLRGGYIGPFHPVCR
jgi:hypothetical protein